ncbi:MAG: hypothetical protein GY839_05965 [candidate division Zixibacteria bacterium]|nr:hypothetical protein [candidate division Zixibacteria bacterium]
MEQSTEGMANQIEFKNRKGFLIFFGVVEIFLGFIFLLFAIMAAIGTSYMNTNTEMNGTPFYTTQIDISLLVYFFIAILIVTLGIGNIKVRRWAKDFTLIVSWYGMILGTISYIFMFVVLSYTLSDLPSESKSIAQVIMFIFGCFFVVVPLVFILFFQSKNVKYTVDSIDTKIGWTDKAPLTVIALYLLTLLGGLAPLMSASYGWAIIFFGTVLHGIPGAMFILLNSGLFILFGYYLYKLDIRGWWGLVLLNITWLINSIITVSNVSILELYEKMNLPPESLHQIENMPFLNSKIFLIYSFVLFSFLMGYMFLIKKHFSPKTVS